LVTKSSNTHKLYIQQKCIQPFICTGYVYIQL